MSAVAGVSIVPGMVSMSSSPAELLAAEAVERGISVMLVVGRMVMGDGWHRGPPGAAVVRRRHRKPSIALEGQEVVLQNEDR
jgi:hypothetical protein